MWNGKNCRYPFRFRSVSVPVVVCVHLTFVDDSYVYCSKQMVQNKQRVLMCYCLCHFHVELLGLDGLRTHRTGQLIFEGSYLILCR